MLKEIVQAHSASAVSIHVVWIPMVPGDGFRAARQTGSMFPESVHQYFDRGRTLGLAYSNEVFAGCLERALRATPREHPLHEIIAEWATHRRVGPLWDAVLYYEPGILWGDRIPSPTSWSKQVMFFDDQAGEATGTFFRNDCASPPVDSDWFRELRTLPKRID